MKPLFQLVDMSLIARFLTYAYAFRLKKLYAMTSWRHVLVDTNAGLEGGPYQSLQFKWRIGRISTWKLEHIYRPVFKSVFQSVGMSLIARSFLGYAVRLKRLYAMISWPLLLADTNAGLDGGPYLSLQFKWRIGQIQLRN